MCLFSMKNDKKSVEKLPNSSQFIQILNNLIFRLMALLKMGVAIGLAYGTNFLYRYLEAKGVIHIDLSKLQ